MGSIPLHPFMYNLCAELENEHKFFENPNTLILETTGPFMLTRIYEIYDDKPCIKILDPDHVYPLTKNDLERLEDLGAPDEGMRNKLARAYGVHYYAGTWWKKKRAVHY